MLLRDLKKYALLAERSERYGCPWIEYDEKVTAPMLLLLRLDLERLKKELWFPRSVDGGRAVVIACEPTPEVAERVKKELGVTGVDFFVTLPWDMVRIIEHNQDLNPAFPPPAGRTPLAKVRTYLAGRRSLFAHYRTLLAKSRTGLAFIRTGISFISIALLFIRVFGTGFLLFLEAPLLVVGCIMAFDGAKWYMGARKIHDLLPSCVGTEATGGTTVLQARGENGGMVFPRSASVTGAAELRNNWTSMSPVMRRRFLASDRTDFAEERTVLACYRTRMAKARTGLAFVRTGLSFVSLGFGLIRQFHVSLWISFDLSLIAIGALMVGEGFLWYSSGRQAGVEGYATALTRNMMKSIWDLTFPHPHNQPIPAVQPVPLPVRGSHLPGIWATTGVALERTVLAERRNVMARLRTVMACSRTGLAFVRTGLSIFMIGTAFTLYFHDGGLGWAVFDTLMLVGGLLLVADGLYWCLPAERYRRQFPYCFGDIEFAIPYYGTPARYWRKVVFSHE